MWQSRKFFGGLALVGAVALTNVMITTSASAGSGDWSAARIWDEQLLAAIRINTPRPPVHARNLYHTSVAMWDAWAAYDPVASQVCHIETSAAIDVEAARHETISYAAFRILKQRFATGPGSATIQANINAQMTASGYDPTNLSTVGDTPAALGNRIGTAVLSAFFGDRANEPSYAANNGYATVNPAMVIDLPGTNIVNPNRWQPLAFDYYVKQNGIVVGATIQSFVCPHWRGVRTFAMNASDYGPNAYHDPGLPPQLGGYLDSQFKTEVVELIEKGARLDPNDGETMDISPASFGNNSLGFNDGQGYLVNPVTRLPYTPQIVKVADMWRVLSEFWADGPNSETPPGHWNTIANYVSDYPGFEKRIGGVGPIVNDLEWDVKVYLAVNGAVHDAAITSWGIKGTYDGVRPISMIRHMAGLGQSSFPTAPSFHENGLPLVRDRIALITEDTIAKGGIHENLPEFVEDPPDSGEFYWEDHVGDIAVYCWRGHPADPLTEIGGVGWIVATKWWPYMGPNFVTPPFAGYTSGHSTFSRSAAEVMTGITGSEFFPGGMAEFHAPAGTFLDIEYGPTTDVTLQWAKYYDGADQAGIARLYSGIHVKADDYSGRVTGSVVGIDAWAKAQEYFNGTVCLSDIQGDDQVDVLDLLMVIGEWGPCTGGNPCFADVKFDNTVNVLDLLQIIGAWGACP